MVTEVVADVLPAVPFDAAPERRLAPYAFERIYGRPPAAVGESPGGLSLIGGRDDRYGLAIPVPWGGLVAVAARTDGVVSLCSAVSAGDVFVAPIRSLDDPPAWAAPVVGVLDALHLGERDGADILISPGLPGGRGFPSEAGLVSAAESAFADLWGHRLALAQLARFADVAELVAARSCPDAAAVRVDREASDWDFLPLDLGALDLRVMMIDLGRSPSPIAGRRRDAPIDLGGAGSLGAADRAAIAAALHDAGSVPPPLEPAFAAALAAGALAAHAVAGPWARLIALVRFAALADVRRSVSSAWAGPRRPRFLTMVATRDGRPIR